MSGGTWQFVLLGLGVGTLVGMTGMGGGSLMTPLLMLVFGFDPGKAVGTDLIHGAIFKSFGAARHRVLGTIHNAAGPLDALRLGADVAGRGLVLAPPGQGRRSACRREIIAAALILGGIGFLLKTFVKRGVQASEAAFHAPPARQGDRLGAGSDRRLRRRSHLGRQRHLLRAGDAARLPAHGAGASSAPTSSTRPRSAGWPGSATSPAVSVAWHAVLWMLPGSIPGIMIGSQISVGIPDRVLRVAFSVVLMLSGIKLLQPLPSRWTNIVVLRRTRVQRDRLLGLGNRLPSLSPRSRSRGPGARRLEPAPRPRRAAA